MTADSLRIDVCMDYVATCQEVLRQPRTVG